MRVQPVRNARVAIFFTVLVAVLGLGANAFAQSVTSGTIQGRVTDETEAALPGVTVTVTSPALLQSRSETSDSEGNYRFPDLPIGEYRIAWELSGFQQLVRENILLSSGFIATINVALK